MDRVRINFGSLDFGADRMAYKQQPTRIARQPTVAPGCGGALWLRTKQHKLIFYYGLPLGPTDYEPTEPEWEFFDLLKDPGRCIIGTMTACMPGCVNPLKQTLQ